MTSVYLLSAILGLGLLIFSTLSGGASHFLLGLFGTRNLTFLLAAFGATGLLLTLFRVDRAITLVLAMGLGVVSMGLAHGVFTWLRRTDSAVEVLGDDDFQGELARVVLPIGTGSQGQVACVIAGREVYLTAVLAGEVEGPLAIGREVIILSTAQGVAAVMPATQLEIPPST